MNDLRKAAEMALEALNDDPKMLGDWLDNLKAARETLRQALAQPEEKMHIEGNGKLTTKPYPDGYESEQQFRKALAQREWVGLTDEEVESWRGNYDFFDSALVREVEAKLKEKNT